MSTDDATTIDVGAWFATLLRNWWVILGLVVLGAVVGGLVTLAAPKEYSATSSVYIGQTTDANGNPMAGLNSNSKAATQLLTSQALLNEAAEEHRHGHHRRQAAQGDHRRDAVVDGQDVDLRGQHRRDHRHRHRQGARSGGGQRPRRRPAGAHQPRRRREDRRARGAARDGREERWPHPWRSSTSAQAGLAAIARGGGSTAEKAAASAPYVAIVQAAATEQEALRVSQSEDGAHASHGQAGRAATRPPRGRRARFAERAPASRSTSPPAPWPAS